MKKEDKNAMIVIIVSILLIVIVLIRNADVLINKNNIVNRNNNDNDYQINVIEEKSEIDNYWYYVIGMIKNDSNNYYEQVLIQYIALDKNGFNLVTCSDMAYKLYPGDTYSFKATCITDKNNVNNYQLKRVIPVESIQ